MAVSWRQCHDALGLATVYGVAQASLERLSGSGKWGLPSNSQCPHILVFMLNLPLFTGGLGLSQLQEKMPSWHIFIY